MSPRIQRISANSEAPERSNKRLTVRLVHRGQPDRVLEFQGAGEGARVLGCAPTSDVVLRERGVLPVHCYFERERGDIWLSAAQASAEIRVNYQPVAARIKLGRRSIVEVGGARLQIVVSESDEDTPHHGPFGTEVIGLRVPHPVDLLETASVDAAVALGEVPTTAWKREEIVASEDDETLVARSGHARAEAPGPASPSPCEHTDHTSQLGTPSSAMLTLLTTTQRIPHDELPGKPAVESGEPLRPSPCVLVEPQSGVLTKPATLVRATSDDDTVPAVSRSPRLQGASPIPMQPAGPSYLVATTPQAWVSQECPAPITESESMDAEILARSGQLGERPAANPDAALGMRHTPPGPLSTFAAFRQRFAIRWGREPRVVAMIALAAALSLSALVSQAARGWREIVEFAASGSRAHPRPDRPTHAR